MKTYASPEHLYFSEVLGVDTVLLPEDLKKMKIDTQKSSDSKISNWAYSGTERSVILCIDDGSSEKNSTDILKKMMAAISITNFCRARLLNLNGEKPDVQGFAGKYGIVFGEQAFLKLQTSHTHSAVVGKFVRFNDLNILVTYGIDEMLNLDLGKSVKSKVWDHLKRLREVMRVAH